MRPLLATLFSLALFMTPIAAQGEFQAKGAPAARQRKANRAQKADQVPDGLQRITWKVGSVEREGLIYLPPEGKRSEHPPLIIVFHGHGGSSANAARRLAVHQFWPEAICLYPQGLPTPSPVLDPQGKHSGWQRRPGDQGDRDLALFDAMMKSMKRDYHIDETRVYCAGHSNGGLMVYTLWGTRGDELAAIAPIAAPVGPIKAPQYRPLPVFHFAGKKDQTVPLALQQETIDRVLAFNGCPKPGEFDGRSYTYYASDKGAPVATFIHPGGHEIPPAAAKLIVAFFKDQAQTPASDL